MSKMTSISKMASYFSFKVLAKSCFVFLVYVWEAGSLLKDFAEAVLLHYIFEGSIKLKYLGFGS